jgi:hypothetical protein
VNILRFLQTVDRRFLYAMILFVVAAPFFITIRLPADVSPPTEALYNAIERLKPGDFVLVSMDWSAGSRGENRPQSIALLHHLMRKKARIGLLSFDAQSKALVQPIITGIASDPRYGYHYREGIDWINFGYRVDQDNYLKGFVADVPGAQINDIHDRPVVGQPVMHGIKTARDITMILDVTPADTYSSYIKFVQGPYHTLLGVAPTAVMVPEAMNRFDSKQIVGLIPGLAGAHEYEQKLGIAGTATAAALSLSAAHLLIIAFIVMGNVAMVLERRQKARAEMNS